MFKFENGARVKDVVTGYQGTVTARCDYLGDPGRRYQVERDGDADHQWFDECRLEVRS